MAVDVSSLSNSNTWVTLYSSINTASDGVFGIAILFAIWFLLLVLYKRYDTIAAFFASSLITSVISLFMFYMQWVGEFGPTFFIVLTAIFTFLLVTKNN